MAKGTITIPTTITTILAERVESAKTIGIGLTNTGANLNAFRVRGRFTQGGTWFTLKSTSGHFTSPTGIVKDASGDLTTLATGSSGWVVLDVTGLFEYDVQASVAAATTSIAFESSMKVV